MEDRLKEKRIVDKVKASVKQLVTEELKMLVEESLEDILRRCTTTPGVESVLSFLTSWSKYR